MATVAQLLLARRDDDRPAILFEDSVYSYRETVAASAARATTAQSRRRPGPFHIGVLLDNTPEYLFWIGAAALSGAAVVGINPTRRGAELAADIRHTDCQLIVTDTEHLPLLAGLDTGVGPDHMLLVDAVDLAPTRPAAGDAVDESTTLLLLFTSGSSGAPKAVVCTQGRLARIAATSAPLFDITADTITYQAMPLFHGNAIMANWAPALAQGATVALRRRFSASGFLADVRRFRATYFNYVGRALAYILATPPTGHDADNCLELGFGTEASARDMELFSARFGCRILENYGSSEGVITIHRQPGTPKAALGRPPEGRAFDIIVADPATGLECPPARFDGHGGIVNASQAIGELVNRAGAGSFEGYYANEAANAERLRDGWYWSGDLGYRDEDGWYYFAGRNSDWLRVDGENFAAAPIERILHRWPGVVMAAVYPIPDPRTGDQVMAALELESGCSFDVARFEAFLESQPDLGTKWAPRFVRIVAAMPLTGTNKVAKQPLRQEYWRTADPVWWQPERGRPYRRLTADDALSLRQQFDLNGRVSLLTV